MSNTTCIWRQIDDEHTPNTWQADCGAMWTFTDGGPKGNDMHFCPNCGKLCAEAALETAEQPAPVQGWKLVPYALTPEMSHMVETEMEGRDFTDFWRDLLNAAPQPAKPIPTKCWKCGDADPAFTAVCQVPACGMREAP